MPRAHAISGVVAHGTLALCLGSCGLLEIGPASRISEIEPVSVRVRVLELGPLNPERVAYPSDAPISEFMPGDRVRFEIEVVDLDGLALPDEELDSVWFFRTQHEDHRPSVVPLDDPRLDVRCDELELWTLRTPCRLGEGRGSIELTIPGFEETLTNDNAVVVYAVIAWNGQSAEECWTARRADVGLPTDCGFVGHFARFGPQWWLLAHAAELGVATSVPIDRFHPALFLQQANRAPQLDHIVVELGNASMELTANDGIVGPIAVEPGQRLRLTLHVDESQQFFQSYFFPYNADADLFGLTPETVGVRVATAGPISAGQANPIPIDAPIGVEVAEDAEPGIARLVLALVDDRGAEDVVRVELEIQ